MPVISGELDTGESFTLSGHIGQLPYSDKARSWTQGTRINNTVGSVECA
jgi:hypothetical protein